MDGPVRYSKLYKHDPNQRWRDKAYRITKYDPHYRNELGHYKRDEWTSYSDIGQVFDGVKLTKKQYLRTEQLYIDAIALFMRYVQSSQLIPCQLENKIHSDVNDFILNGDQLLYGCYTRLASERPVTGEEIEKTLRVILREYAWCSFVVDMKTSSLIHFGYDYYMYFVSDAAIDELAPAITDLGLFVG